MAETTAAASDPALLTLTELAAAIAGRRLSSAEVTAALLARIVAWQPHINAFVRIEAEQAMALARAADDALARGAARGPLHGVPFAHKDMYYAKGKPCGCGSKLREGWIAPVTATAIARLEAAGSFRLGALHMAEFAYGPTGHNPYLGHARNPWRPDRITGGSSSGSGAAVAARLTPAALGSDTGGSIRLPAHFCGVTGFKPTYGRVSRANALPLSFSLDTVGPLAHSAADCGLLMEALAGPDPLDPTTWGAPPWDAAAAAVQPERLTIGVPDSFYVEDLEADIADALDATLREMETLGHRIVQVTLPDQTLVAAAALLVLAVEATAAHAAWLRERPEDYGAQVRARLENGLAYSAVDYLEALRWRGPALAAHLEAVAGVDVVIAPASRETAPSIADTDVGGGPNAEATIVGITRFMRPLNFLGLPVLVVPAGQSRDGMPIGLQLIGRPFEDERLIAFGRAFQAATDHHQRMPGLPL
jgi:aspartyl-tRNA(Asn)/glutamyl-tRNA(Gln) amidotransferase subunit A